MNPIAFNIIILVCISFIILYMHHFLSSRHVDITNDNDKTFEHFQEARKDENICIKPFSVTNQKEKVFKALLSLEERIDELEYNIRRSGKKYETMYQWYKRKTTREGVESKKATDEMKDKIKSSITDQIEKAQQEFALQQSKQKVEVEFNNKLGNIPTTSSNVESQGVAQDALRKAFSSSKSIDEQQEMLSDINKIM